MGNKNGKVILIGAGPGDPELMTVKGKRVLMEADVVLYDALVAHELLKWTKPGAELILVGKRPFDHSVSQDQINQLLWEKACEKKVVVRLKGGDPYVFGRGAEEVIFLTERGIEVETVPGISSAVAVPAHAGIPLTHRGIANSCAIVAGHGKNGEFEIQVPKADTLVYLMCVTNLEKIVARVRSAQFSFDTPCAVIENGTTDQERVIVGTLANVVELAKVAKLRPPAILIIGEVVRLREKILEKHLLSGEEAIFTSTFTDSDFAANCVAGIFKEG